MIKPPFLESPQRWTRTPRLSQSAVEYASAIEGHVHLDTTHAANGRIMRFAMVIIFFTLLLAAFK
jgi:hypothetical protein